MKKIIPVLCCLLLSLLLAVCGSASAEGTPPPSPAAPVGTPEPTPAVTSETVVAALNEELRKQDEAAYQEYIQAHPDEAPANGLKKQSTMHFMVMDDGRIALNINEVVVALMALQCETPDAGVDTATLREAYYQYLNLLLNLQKITEEQVREQLPDAEVVVRFYVEDSFLNLLVQVENGKIVYDRVNGVDSIGLSASPSPTPIA